MRAIIVFILFVISTLFFASYAVEYLEWVAAIEKQRLDQYLTHEQRKAVIDRLLDNP
jgi:hypothetical protein